MHTIPPRQAARLAAEWCALAENLRCRDCGTLTVAALAGRYPRCPRCCGTVLIPVEARPMAGASGKRAA